jgi:hypothetical protein
MLHAAYKDDYWKKGEPGTILNAYENIERLIEAVFLINSNKNNAEEANASLSTDENIIQQAVVDPALYCGWHDKRKAWEFFPRHLSKKEFINPYTVFQKFFKFHDLATWREELHELFFCSLISDSTVRTGIDLDYLGIYKHLQKLIEAAHLIDIREIFEIDGIERSKFKRQKVVATEEIKNEDTHTETSATK